VIERLLWIQLYGLSDRRDRLVQDPFLVIAIGDGEVGIGIPRIDLKRLFEGRDRLVQVPLALGAQPLPEQLLLGRHPLVPSRLMIVSPEGQNAMRLAMVHEGYYHGCCFLSILFELWLSLMR